MCGNYSCQEEQEQTIHDDELMTKSSYFHENNVNQLLTQQDMAPQSKVPQLNFSNTGKPPGITTLVLPQANASQQQELFEEDQVMNFND